METTVKQIKTNAYARGDHLRLLPSPARTVEDRRSVASPSFGRAGDLFFWLYVLAFAVIILLLGSRQVQAQPTIVHWQIAPADGERYLEYFTRSNLWYVKTSAMAEQRVSLGFTTEPGKSYLVISRYAFGTNVAHETESRGSFWVTNTPPLVSGYSRYVGVSFGTYGPQRFFKIVEVP